MGRSCPCLDDAGPGARAAPLVRGQRAGPVGRPLAGAAVDRWLASAQDGLGGGIALPFAMALLEYDIEPQQLAIDVASGAVDLALEAELLREPDRRAIAEAEARRLAGAALDRIDADRIARRELLDLLGEARRPWLGTTVSEPDLDGALDEAADARGRPATTCCGSRSRSAGSSPTGCTTRASTSRMASARSIGVPTRELEQRVGRGGEVG